MGDCYTVNLRAKLIDEQAAVDALNLFLKRYQGADFSLDKYAEQGVTPDTFDGLMSIFFAGWEGQRVDVLRDKGGWTEYRNDFNASYGWGVVLEAMIEMLAPYLEDGSTFTVDAAETHLDYEIEGGELSAAA